MDNDWSGLIGPVVIAVAAIAGAAVAAYVAIRNHQRELEHDRNERQRENSRVVLDEAIETVISALGSFADFEALLRSSEDRRSEMESKLADAEADQKSAIEAAIRDIRIELDAAFKGLESILRELAASTARVALRFGIDGDISNAYDGFGDAYRAYAQVLVRGVDSNQTEAQRKEMEEVEEGTEVPFAHLMGLCERWHAEPEPSS